MNHNEPASAGPEAENSSTEDEQDAGRPFEFEEFIPTRTANSRILAEIRESPRTRREIGDTTISNGVRELVERIYVPGVSEQGHTRAVYYIYGDERRAARTFIEENPHIVHEATRNPESALRENVHPFMFTIIMEEFQLGGYEDMSPEEIAAASAENRGENSTESGEKSAENSPENSATASGENPEENPAESPENSPEKSAEQQS